MKLLVPGFHLLDTPGFESDPARRQLLITAIEEGLVPPLCRLREKGDRYSEKKSVFKLLFPAGGGWGLCQTGLHSICLPQVVFVLGTTSP